MIKIIVYTIKINYILNILHDQSNSTIKINNILNILHDHRKSTIKINYILTILNDQDNSTIIKINCILNMYNFKLTIY